MTTDQDQLIRDALHRIGDRAAPADRLKERALRTAARRRALSMAAGAVGAAIAAVAIVGPIGLLRDSSARPATTAVRPPTNVLSSCMPRDPHFWPSKDEKLPVKHAATSTVPGHRAADFRVLVELHDAKGTVALLGSSVAYQVCRLDRFGRPDRMTVTPAGWGFANYWQLLNAQPDKKELGTSGKPHKPDLFKDVSGIKDLGTGIISMIGVSTEGIVAGHLPPKVVRLTVTHNGSKSDATVSHGFFIWRGPLLNTEIQKPETFRGYDVAGRLVVTLHGTKS